LRHYPKITVQAKKTLHFQLKNCIFANYLKLRQSNMAGMKLPAYLGEQSAENAEQKEVE